MMMNVGDVSSLLFSMFFLVVVLEQQPLRCIFCLSRDFLVVSCCLIDVFFCCRLLFCFSCRRFIAAAVRCILKQANKHTAAADANAFSRFPSFPQCKVIHSFHRFVNVGEH